jgi:hypothetical protein
MNVLKNVGKFCVPYEIVGAFGSRQVRPQFLVRGMGGGNLNDGEAA